MARTFVFGPGAIMRLEASALGGRDLDRFSRFTFDAFDNRLRGYPSAGVRFDRGGRAAHVGHLGGGAWLSGSTASWTRPWSTIPSRSARARATSARERPWSGAARTLLLNVDVGLRLRGAGPRRRARDAHGARHRLKVL
jgi:hypothetical protein